MRKIELKPCPFCGGEAKIKRTIRLGLYWAYCDNGKCRLRVETDNFETESEVIAAWNTRYTEEESNDEQD